MNKPNKTNKAPRLKAIPKFKNEDEAAEFWLTHCSTDYVDWSKAKKTSFPNLLPTTRSISIRLPVSMIDRLKMLANKRAIPYQALLKLYVAERLDKEMK